MSPKRDAFHERFTANFFSESSACRLCLAERTWRTEEKISCFAWVGHIKHQRFTIQFFSSIIQTKRYAAVAVTNHDAVSFPDRVVMQEKHVPFQRGMMSGESIANHFYRSRDVTGGNKWVECNRVDNNDQLKRTEKKKCHKMNVW